MASVSSDIPVTDNYVSDCTLGTDDKLKIIFHPDYIDYGGTYYLDSVVNFTKDSIEAKSKPSNGDEQILHILLEISDIVKIESQWSAQCGIGTITIYFIAKCASKDSIFLNDSVSGIQELKFPARDANWYEKHEAIESLNDRYKALWNVLLDTGVDRTPPLPEGKAMLHHWSYFPNFDKPFGEIIYPEGDPDAVSLSKRDIDLLLPDTFVNDTIMDFYIKYLKSKLTTGQKTKFHFFNSFFFRKLADMDKDPSSAFDGKAAFQRVRKWTRKVNLLEKDFIFIPVNYSLHWSLIVICYFGEAAVSEDATDEKITRVPCILHMDSFKGTHKDLKDLMQSYLWEEWKERQKETCEEMHSKFRNLKFVSLELPQQQNLYDCGLFVLHYVERFLEDVPPYFNIHSVTSSAKFLQADWFPPSEASLKRTRIERLLKVLIDNQSTDSFPFYERGIGCFSGDSKTEHDQHNNTQYLGKSSVPLRSNDESSICPVSEEIDMARLPSSSGMKSSASDLFDQGTCNETWVALEHRSSLDEFEKPVSLTQEDAEASACYTQAVLTEPNFQHLDQVNHGAHLFPYSSGNFRLEPDHLQPRSDDVDSSPVSKSDNAVFEMVAADEKSQPAEADIEAARHSPVVAENPNIAAAESRDEINSKDDEPLPAANCISSAYDCFTEYSCSLISGNNLECGEQGYQKVSDLMLQDTPHEVEEEDTNRSEQVVQHAAKRARFSLPDDEWKLTVN